VKLKEKTESRYHEKATLWGDWLIW
jgi:hypothetical protein